jgi:hypothetical protein
VTKSENPSIHPTAIPAFAPPESLLDGLFENEDVDALGPKSENEVVLAAVDPRVGVDLFGVEVATDIVCPRVAAIFTPRLS